MVAMGGVRVRQDSSKVSSRTLHGVLLALAAAGHVVAVLAFLALPWASGRGVLDGYQVAGPELARVTRNVDLFLPAWAGRVALPLTIALYAIPAGAIAGILLVLLSRWTDRSRDALRAAALAGLVVAGISAAVVGILVAGFASGELGNAALGSGPFVAGTGGVLAGFAAHAATRTVKPR
jgi:hypothetical protein